MQSAETRRCYAIRGAFHVARRAVRHTLSFYFALTEGAALAAGAPAVFEPADDCGIAGFHSRASACAFMTSSGVISFAIRSRLRSALLRVPSSSALPAARLNHLCASTGSLGTP